MHKRSDKEVLTNRAGNIYQAVKSPLNLFCERPFNHLDIGFDGSILLCCQDWKFEEVMGKINEKSIMEVWCSKKYEKKRRDLLGFKRTGLCAKCDWRGFGSLTGRLWK